MLTYNYAKGEDKMRRRNRAPYVMEGVGMADIVGLMEVEPVLRYFPQITARVVACYIIQMIDDGFTQEVIELTLNQPATRTCILGAVYSHVGDETFGTTNQ